MLERERFFPLGTLWLSCRRPPLDGRTNSKNLMPSQKFPGIWFHPTQILSLVWLLCWSSHCLHCLIKPNTRPSFHIHTPKILSPLMASHSIKVVMLNFLGGEFIWYFWGDWTWQSPQPLLLISGEIGEARSARWTQLEAWDLILDFMTRSLDSTQKLGLYKLFEYCYFSALLFGSLCPQIHSRNSLRALR